MAHYLNAFRVTLSGDEFRSYEVDCPEPIGVRKLREQHGKDWFFIWYGGKAYALPRQDGSDGVGLGKPVDLRISDHLGARVLTTRLGDRISSLFKSKPIQVPGRRPYSVLANHNELVGDLLKSVTNPPGLASKFKIRPRFVFDPRLVELEEGRLEIILVVGIRMHWQIKAEIGELAEAGIDLSGLHVLWRERPEDAPYLAGKIARVEGEDVILSESWDGSESQPASLLNLEPSTMSFSRCLSHLLGSSYDSFVKERFVLEGNFLTGIGYTNALKEWGKFLRKRNVWLAPGISCTFGRALKLEAAGENIIRESPQIQHCYDPARTQRHPYAWEGLVEHGPYSSESLGIRKPSVLIVVPASLEGRVDQFLAKFFRGIPQNSAKGFRDGFLKVFGLLAPETRKIVVPDSALRTDPVTGYVASLKEHFADTSIPTYDLALVFLRNADTALPVAESPYFRCKSFLLNHGIPDQQIREATLSKSGIGLDYALRNIAIACYAKVGGTPWTVDHDQTYDDEVVIGMGSCELSDSRFRERQRYVGITTVFRGDGDYLLSNVSRECKYEDYPATLLEAVKAVLIETKRRNGWQKGDNVKVVLHAYKPLKNLEIEQFMVEAITAVSGEQNVKFAFVEINEAHNFRVLSDVRRQPAHHSRVPDRGTVVRLGRNTRLVCVRGTLQMRRPDSPLPAPLLVHVHESSTYSDRDYLAEQVLKFTSLSWRSALPGRMPVTIRYSELIARMLAQLRTVPSWSSDVLETKLKPKRWFL